jgi:nitroreductase/NAD-dependent dihydropyrimidine dehydrogenase PreA subunit
MELIQIDEKTCTCCGVCAEECPEHLIVVPAGQYPASIAGKDALCIRCGHCVAVCPSGSLDHRELALQNSPQILEGLKVTPEQCEQSLKSRRSVRVFNSQAVPRETIKRLIEDARYAPTGHNNQELEWLVIDSRSELDRIEELGTDWIRLAIKNLPQMAALFDMPEMLKRQEKDRNQFLRGCPVLIIVHAAKDNPIAVIDSATALGYLDLAANSLGLGTCWAGFVYMMANGFPPVKQAIGLPEGHTTYGAMMLGYNKFKHQRIPVRKEPRIVWR